MKQLIICLTLITAFTACQKDDSTFLNRDELIGSVWKEYRREHSEYDINGNRINSRIVDMDDRSTVWEGETIGHDKLYFEATFCGQWIHFDDQETPVRYKYWTDPFHIEGRHLTIGSDSYEILSSQEFVYEFIYEYNPPYNRTYRRTKSWFRRSKTTETWDEAVKRFDAINEQYQQKRGE